MHDSHGKWPKHLVQADLLQHLRKATLRRLFQVHMNFRSMRMHVLVTLRAMLVRMGMHNLSVRMSGSKSIGDPLRDAGKVQYAQQDEHQADRQFHRQANLDWNRQIENDDARSNHQNRQRVAQSPEGADETGMANAVLAAYDRGYSYNVVGIGRMSHPE